MPAESQLYVVFDANILIRDLWMEGAGFSYLRSHQFLGHRPAIPEVAFQEARNHLRRRALELVSNQNRSKGNIRRLLQVFHYRRYRKNNNWDVESLTKRWERYIKQVLAAFGGKLQPHPDVALKEVTERSLKRTKPFSDGDRGFKDTLIWLSTLDLIGPKTRVSFLTGNTLDFFEPNSNSPHPHLAAEARVRLGEEWNILFHRSVDDFIVNLDSNRSASAEALQRALVSDSLSGFSLWHWFDENLVDVLSEYEFDELSWAGFPYDAEAPVLIEVEDILGLDLPRIRHLEKETYLFYCDIAFVGIFECEVGYNAAETIISPKQILSKNESDPYWTSVEMRTCATFLFRIEFDIVTKTILASHALPLSHWKSYDKSIDSLNEDLAQLNEIEE